MKKQILKNFGSKLKKFFTQESLNELGRALNLSKRKREITPYKLAVALITIMADHRIESIADIHRGFNKMFGTNIQYKPLHNQLSKNEFPIFMKSVLEGLLNDFAVQALSFNDDSPFAIFKKILLQDGSSFAIKDALSDEFPGRFKKTNPAAVELHVALELLTETVQSITLTPDTTSEAQFLPKVSEFNDEKTLVMGDRGYLKKSYIHDVVKSENVSCIIKGKSNMNPIVNQVILENGQVVKAWKGKELNELKSKLRKNSVMDMDIQWSDNKKPFDCRLIVSWNPETKCYQYLVTDLPRSEFTSQQIIEAYHLRWQIELMFKEWKSYANLRKFNTEKSSIMEGLIWCSICAATLKRYFAQLTQKITRTAISTHKVAKSGCYFISDVMGALIKDTASLMKEIQNAVIFIKNNAQRDSLKKDRKTGRSKLGLESNYLIGEI